MDLSDFFRLMANMANMNVVLHPAVQGKVNLMVKEGAWEEVLDLVLKNHGLGKEIEGNSFALRKYGEKQSEVLSHEKILTLFQELNSYPKKFVQDT